MGEIAEMMLDGTLCAGCGVYIDDEEGDGIPRYCSEECAAGCGERYRCDPVPSRTNQRKAERINRERAGRKLFGCSDCGRRFHSEFGAKMHHRDVHEKTAL